MKKLILFTLFSVFAVVSCNKAADIESPSEASTPKIVIKATGSVATKFDYSENAGKLDLTFNNDAKAYDLLHVYFQKSDGVTQTGSRQAFKIASIDGVSGVASFASASNVEIPADAANVFAYLDNAYTPITYPSSPSMLPLATQTGELNSTVDGAHSANHLQVAVGHADLTEPAVYDGSGNRVVTMTFDYKTSIVKFDVTFPAGFTPTTSTSLTLVSPEDKFYNQVHLSWGNPGVQSVRGPIVFTPSSVSGQVATAYVALWGGDDLSGSVIFAMDGDDFYYALFNPASSLAAGKFYRASRTLVAGTRHDVWTPDSAGDVTTAVTGASVVVGCSWLSYNSSTGVITATENNTGNIRSGRVLLSTGDCYNVTQLSPVDFKGSYTLQAKIFSNNTGAAKAGSPGSKDVTIGNPVLGETLSNIEDGNTYTNQIGVHGMYYEAVMDGTVDIDYDLRTARVGLMFDCRSAQAVTNGVAGYNYGYFTPAFATSSTPGSWSSPWYFNAVSLGNKQNYAWLWFVVSEDFRTISYSPNNASTMQKLTNTGLEAVEPAASAGANTIVGICACTTSSTTISSGTRKSAYEVVYQGNKFTSVDGVVFKRKN